MKSRNDRLVQLSRRELILRTGGILTFAGLGGSLTKTLAQTSSTIVLTPEELKVRIGLMSN